jgi:hypothetical protein
MASMEGFDPPEVLFSIIGPFSKFGRLHFAGRAGRAEVAHEMLGGGTAVDVADAGSECDGREGPDARMGH